MNNNNNGKGKEIFYGVIGVATLVVAVVGATFAYFTATASNETTITGNAATVLLSVDVSKVTHADDTSGLIPMSNSMVEAAVSHAKPEEEDGSNVCVDDNGNAVCQIYEITLTNSSPSSAFVDGYVALINGSGAPSDYQPNYNKTTMRWAQVFKKQDNEQVYTTAGTPDLSVSENGPTFTSIGITTADEGQDAAEAGLNKKNIKTDGVTGSYTIDGSSYDLINTNYIRVSDHQFSNTSESGVITLNADENYTRDDDVTSALVYNQKIAGSTGEPTTITYYIAVWLTETGADQTIGSSGPSAAKNAENFFSGQVKFISAQGGEVSATFSGYNRVEKPE